MYAVVAIFRMSKPDGIVARVSQERGFVAGYRTHEGEHAYNMLIFDSRETAELRAEDVRGNAANQNAAGLVPERIVVAEVIAHATSDAVAQSENVSSLSVAKETLALECCGSDLQDQSPP